MNDLKFASLLVTLFIAMTADGALRSTTTRPVAVRGGVLLLPLEAKPPRSGWPETAALRPEGGPALVGRLAWIHRARRDGDPRWTDDPRQLALRDIRSDDRADGRPCLLVRLPEDGAGTLSLDGQRLEPTWCDAIPSRPEEALPTGTRIDRPDPTSPFEYWRAVLLAERLGEAPPAPPRPADDVRTLCAEHDAALWRVGLERLHAADPPTAVECRTRLTQLANDRGRTFAAWVADPAETAPLLSSLLDARLTVETMVAAARRWLDAREPLLIWVESPGGDVTRLAVVNRTERTLVGQFTWPGAEEIPIAVEFRPEVLHEVLINRPEAPATALAIEAAGRSYEVSVGVASTAARPPGAFAQVLRPPVTLAEVEMRRVQPVDETRVTEVNLRRRFGRWEVFFECRRAAPGAADPARRRDDDRPLVLADAIDVVDLPGEDTVQVLLAPPAASDAEAVQLIVPERGGFQVRHGRDDGTLEVHRRSHPDRWYCRIVLPTGWIPAEDQPLRIGCARTIGTDGGFQIAPGVTTPWRRRLGHTAVRLDAWDSLPQPGG